GFASKVAEGPALTVRGRSEVLLVQLVPEVVAELVVTVELAPVDPHGLILLHLGGARPSHREQRRSSHHRSSPPLAPDQVMDPTALDSHPTGSVVDHVLPRLRVADSG